MNISLSKNKRTISYTLIGLVFLASLVRMWMTDTLTYPFIMAERQYQVIANCVSPNSTFTTETYGFSLEVPQGYCALPHRIFPLDGTVQIIPKGWYFVLNEYISGGISNSAIGTIIFVHDINGAEVARSINSLNMGGFVANATHITATTTSGLPYQYFENASGVATGSTFDWAFATHPKGSSSFMSLTDKIDQRALFKQVIQSISAN